MNMEAPSPRVCTCLLATYSGDIGVDTRRGNCLARPKLKFTRFIVSGYPHHTAYVIN
jgi:hypothetical protein